MSLSKIFRQILLVRPRGLIKSPFIPLILTVVSLRSDSEYPINFRNLTVIRFTTALESKKALAVLSLVTTLMTGNPRVIPNFSTVHMISVLPTSSHACSDDEAFSVKFTDFFTSIFFLFTDSHSLGKCPYSLHFLHLFFRFLQTFLKWPSLPQ